MKLFPLFVVAVGLLGVSCERHDFEETKKLHEKHHADDGDAGNHGDGHEKPAH